MLDFKFKGYESAQFNGAKLALQRDLELPQTGNFEYDENFAGLVVAQVLREFDVKLPKETEQYLDEVANGNLHDLLKK